MSSSSESASKSATRSRLAPSRAIRPTSRLNAAMTWDAAFRVIARRYLEEVTKNHEATRKGDPSALHRMRIALTYLRAAMLSVSRMLADGQQTEITEETCENESEKTA